MPHPVRQRILITGASSGLGEGMARRFAAMGRDLALAARRTDRLDALRDELLAAHPGIRVETSALDIDDPDDVARVIPELADRLGGFDRVIANAGIGKGASVGTGKAKVAPSSPPTCSVPTPPARRRWSCSAPRGRATS